MVVLLLVVLNDGTGMWITVAEESSHRVVISAGIGIFLVVSICVAGLSVILTFSVCIHIMVMIAS